MPNVLASERRRNNRTIQEVAKPLGRHPINRDDFLIARDIKSPASRKAEEFSLQGINM